MEWLSWFVWAMNLTAWIWTLVDINRSEFKNGSGGRWMFWVFVLPFPTMGAYYYWGIRQKQKEPFRFINAGCYKSER